MPFTVADYVDFYASERHASHVGQILRPGTDPLPPAWRHLPIGYHGRAGTVVVSGTDIRRPRGQFPLATSEVHFGPTRRLDFEAELGFVVGAGSDPGRPLEPSTLADHVFGVVLVNDWSARDIQAWEYVPLGPMLGKSFATSISALVTPLAALAQAWVAPPPRDPPPLPHLDDSTAPGALAVDLEIAINGHTVSRPSARALYWTAGQMVAHLTSNGTGLRPGDLFASGTISGPDPDQDGCLLELTENGARPLTLGDGSSREYLLDGDEVTITARAEGALSPLRLGEVRGNILAAGETGCPPAPRIASVDPALAGIEERLAQGQPEALEECYRTLGPLVMSYLGRFVPQPDVEDVMQKVFYEVWRVHDRYDPERPLRAWVLAIARKRAIDHLRKRKDVVVPLDSMREITGDDGRLTAERFVWADEVRTALDQLPEVQRDVIALAYFDGYTQAEIATALDIPLGTVKTRTARGLQRLAGLLESTREQHS